jgi:hypothetical protein
MRFGRHYTPNEVQVARAVYGLVTAWISQHREIFAQIEKIVQRVSFG